MARIVVTYSDVLEALAATVPSKEMPKGAYTMEQIADAMGVQRNQANVRVRALSRKGLVESLRVKMESSLWPGRMYPVPCYRFLKKKK